MAVDLTDIHVYAVGICYASVCAPTEATAQDVEQAASLRHPTGLDHGWKVADEPFTTGEPNPYSAPGCMGRQHWLLVC